MLNYRNIGLLFLVSEFFLVVFTSLQWVSVLFLIFPLIVFLVFLVYGSTVIQSNFYFESHNSLTNPKAVLLTFDDGPNPIITPQILELLKKNNRKAVFFLIGEKAQKYPDLVAKIAESGHTIGNHSFSHSYFFDLKSPRKMIDEIRLTSELLEKQSEKKIVLFRPPFGVTNPNLRKALSITGLKSIGWSFRSFDTGNKPAEKIVSKIKRQIKGGEILLFHDNRPKSFEVLQLAMPFLNNFEQGEVAHAQNI
ncbi:MAG TPA: polysaccharide deacetylase family protein [Bacteroidales bacterium]|nr:polysaccharide deacetylase family protein [Bacteroidales bacterium]